MSARKRQSQLSAVKITLIVVAVALIGFLAYALYVSYRSQGNQPVSTEASDVQAAPEITAPSDLEKAEKSIESAELESSNADDLENIEKDLSEF